VYVNSLVEINFDNNIKPLPEEIEGNSSKNKVSLYHVNNTHEKTIIEFLKQKNLRYCDDCIAKLCNIQPRQTVNQICRRACEKGKIIRGYSQCSYCGNNKITNSFSSKTEQFISPKAEPQKPSSNNNNLNMSEDLVKQLLAEYLEKNGWKAKVSMGKEHGTDIEAYCDNAKWIIEVKGCGSLNAMRVNYFISILGETLQRMDDETSKYSIALPKIQQFINLWNRLPKLAKERTGISALFVDESGNVEEII
jgi:hypothetical protein